MIKFIVVRQGRKTFVAEIMPGNNDTAVVIADTGGSEHNARKLRDALNDLPVKN